MTLIEAYKQVRALSGDRKLTLCLDFGAEWGFRFADKRNTPSNPVIDGDYFSIVDKKNGKLTYLNPFEIGINKLRSAKEISLKQLK